MTAIRDLEIRALNDAEASENRIHSDEIAAKYGFRGALVSGVNVFGYLSQPLARQFGAGLLERTSFDVKFLSPAYHDELLLVRTEELGADDDSTRFKSSAFNAQGTQLAILVSTLWNRIPAIEDAPRTLPRSRELSRSEICWDNIILSEPAPDFLWTPDAEDNRQRVDAQRDQATIYQGATAFIHPYYLLDACNKALMRMFILPAWIHTGSQVTILHPVRVGQQITVRTVPIEKWERKGHQFIRLYIAMIVAGEIAVEVRHTAIFKIAS